MWLSDTSVRRPVLAAVLSLLLVAFGLLSFERLALREYPDIDPPVVTVQTTYPGASAAVVETKITQPIEDAIAGIEGIKTIGSSSLDGLSIISVEFELSRDIDNAANDVRDRVSRVLGALPDEADPPEVQKTTADEQPIIFLHLVSDRLSSIELTDYANRYLVDRLSALNGVARVRISGGLDYAMRIWLDRQALAARNLTVLDVEQALRSQNVELPAGTIKSQDRDFVVRIDRDYQTAEDFERLVLFKGSDGYLVRLGDVARVEVGPAEWRSLFRGNGISMMGLGIVKQSTANALEISRLVRAERERINATLPTGMVLEMSFDSTVFIDSAITEVYSTLLIAAGLVVLVIFMFLGDFRAMLVPAVTVPVSLIATFTVLYALGYSVNLLTLLALVLAIGLVVDDAIVVLENIHRRMSMGETPLVAAYRGARQVGFAVVATTLVLVAVFVPITFLQDNIGRLFGEFAIAMAAAVGFSSLVALTLCPALCANLLKRDSLEGPLAQRVERMFSGMVGAYGRLLRDILNHPWIAGLLLALVVGLSGWLFSQIPSEFTPKEDRGLLFLMTTAPEGASFAYTRDYLLEIERRLMPLVETGEVKRLISRAPAGFSRGENYNSAINLLVLADWGSRRSAMEIVQDVNRRLADLSGVMAFPIMPQALGGFAAKPVQFVIAGGSYQDLAAWRDILVEAASANPGLSGVDSDYKETKPQLLLSVDRNRAGDLGVSALDISRTLETLLGSRRVTTFLLDGEEYDVILEGEPLQQATPQDLDTIYVRAADGAPVPLANLVTVRERGDASTLNRYNRNRAITIEASLNEGYSLGEALRFFEDTVREQLPAGVVIDYKGESLEFQRSSNAVYFMFGLALLVVYLVLAAQFESFVHPFTILLTVPLAVAGALAGLYVWGLTLNIYSQIGIIMLVGLATKNGILIVEFVNQLRDEGRDYDQAIIEACEKRLRPILMTAITTLMGAVPLILASGAGSEARQVIGVVVMSGVAIATLLTLVVVPLVYRWLARNTRSPETVARQLETELESQPRIN